MKITIVGASGLIGTKLVELLTADGHDVVAASRNSGVDVLTGEGLDEALAGADVLVDVVNSPSFEDDPVMNFFTTSTTNQAAAAKKAGVGHYVALSIVGLDGLPDSGYLRAKVAQEKVITEFASLFPATVELGLCAILFAVAFGLPAGIVAAVRRNSIFDHGVMGGFKWSSQHGLCELFGGTGPEPRPVFSSPGSFAACC